MPQAILSSVLPQLEVKHISVAMVHTAHPTGEIARQISNQNEELDPYPVVVRKESSVRDSSPVSYGKVSSTGALHAAQARLAKQTTRVSPVCDSYPSLRSSVWESPGVVFGSAFGANSEMAEKLNPSEIEKGDPASALSQGNGFSENKVNKVELMLRCLALPNRLHNSCHFCCEDDASK